MQQTYPHLRSSGAKKALEPGRRINTLNLQHDSYMRRAGVARVEV